MIPAALHLHGPGKAGTALAAMLQARGARVLGISGGRGASGARAAALLHSAWSPALPALPAETWLLIAVPDDALAQVAGELATGPLPQRGLALHLSAIHDRGVLGALQRRGLRTAAFHPLRALTQTPPADLGGAMVALDAEPADLPQLEELARALGGAPHAVQGSRRTAYHLGAALAGNGPMALLAVAVQVWMRAGFSEAEARRELSSLALMALDNAVRQGPSALTGPVQRGDCGTVQRHLEHMSSAHPADADLLRAVYAVLLRVAATRDSTSHDALRRLLRGDPQ